MLAVALAGSAALGGALLALQLVFRELAAPMAAIGAVPGIADTRPSTCGVCHPAQLGQWASTRMAGAMRDPAFVADFEAQGSPFVCRACHSPLAEQQPTVVTGLWWVRPLVPREDDNPSFEPARVDEGVTCVACHWSDGAMVGPRGAPSVHPTRAGTAPRASCARCHQIPAPPLSNLVRPLSDTHGEWERWRELTGRAEDCVDCHMPGGRHEWRGAWDADTVRSGLGAGVQFGATEVVVTLENRAGHHLPSGDPARALVVRAGAAEVVLARRVPLPRYRDEGDDTLRPAETRTLTLPWDGRSPVEIALEPLRFLPVAADGIRRDGGSLVVPLFSFAPDAPVDGVGSPR